MPLIGSWTSSKLPSRFHAALTWAPGGMLSGSLGEVGHRGRDATLLVRDAGKSQPHFDAGERAHQREIVEVAKVADAEHLAREPSQAGAERHVIGFEYGFSERV